MKMIGHDHFICHSYCHFSVLSHIIRKRLRDSTYETKNKRLVSFGLLISLFPHVWKQFPVFF